MEYYLILSFLELDCKRAGLKVILAILKRLCYALSDLTDGEKLL